MGVPGPRRMAREAALQVLYAADVSDTVNARSVAVCFEEVCAEFSLPAKARRRALELASGVAEHLERIDASIERVSAHWKMNRIATVDRNVLRIAAYELLCENETPSEVIIDEAVEVARRFADRESPRFVNGVLDALARERVVASP
jgi:N utilization substance protein B